MRRLILPALLVLGALCVVATPLHADDDESVSTRARPDFLRQLKPAELSFLKEKIRGWEQLSLEKRQRVAQNVIRMRTMTPTEKQRLEGHIKRMQSRDRQGRRGRYDHAGRALVGRALARAARKQLGRDLERTLRRRDISDHAFEVSVVGTFMRKVVERRAAAGDPPAPDRLPADFPARWREHYAEKYAEFAALPADAKQRGAMAGRLYFKLSMVDHERLRAKVRAMDVKGEAQLEAIADAARAQFGEAFAETLADPEALVRGAETYELRRAVGRIVRRSERLDKDEAAALVSLLNRLAVHHRQKPADADARTASDAVLKDVLRREFKATDEELAAMPSADDAEARQAFLVRLATRRYMHGAGQRHGSKRGSNGSRAAGRRSMPKLEQPEGVSDADWAIYSAARDKALQAKDWDALRRLRTQKPEGMSDAGYRAVLEALQARMAAWSERMKKGDRRGRGDRRGKRER